MSHTSSLLNLPYELQARIFGHVFDDAVLIYNNEGRSCPETVNHSILLTCQQLYSAFLALYHSRLTLRIVAIDGLLLAFNTKTYRSALFAPLRNLSVAVGSELWDFFHRLSNKDAIDREAIVVFDCCPLLTNITFDSRSSSATESVWVLDCRHYVPPRDEASFVKLTKDFGGVRYNRPISMPSHVRCWKKAEFLIEWKCEESPEEQKDKRCTICGSPEPRGTEYRCVVVECM